MIGASAGSHVCEGGGGPGAEVRLSGAGKPLRAGEWCNVRAAGRSRQRTTEHTCCSQLRAWALSRLGWEVICWML